MFSRLFSANRVAERFYNKNNSIKVKKQSVFHFFSFVQVSFFSLLSNWCLYCLLNDILQDCSQQNKRDGAVTERSLPKTLLKQLSSLFSFLARGSIPFQYFIFAYNMVPRVNKLDDYRWCNLKLQVNIARRCQNPKKVLSTHVMLVTRVDKLKAPADLSTFQTCYNLC